MARLLSIGLAAFAYFFAAAFAQNNCSSAVNVNITAWQGPLIPNVKISDPCVHNDTDGNLYVYSDTDVQWPGQDNETTIYVPYAYTNQGNWYGWNYSYPDGTRFDAMPGGPGAWANYSNVELVVGTPDVNRLNNGYDHLYIMYYTAYQNNKTSSNPERCTGFATSISPMGPFNASDTPIYCPDFGGAIGADGVYDQQGPSRWVVFKNPSCPSGGCDPKLRMYEVDGSTGIPHPEPTNSDIYNLTNSPNYLGEEGPALVLQGDGRWLLLHTEGIYNYNYSIRYALSDNQNGVINGTYTDYDNCTILADGEGSGSGPLNNPQVWSPGSPDFIGASTSMMIFAAFNQSQSICGGQGKCPGFRMLYQANLTYGPKSNGHHK